MVPKRIVRSAIIVIALMAVADLAAARQDGAGQLLSLDRIFGSREFASERFGPARWMRDGDSYTTLEKSTEAGNGRDIVLYHAGTGKRDILVSASSLIPAGGKGPLDIEDYQWSEDAKLLLLFTNSKRVWRQNTRGDYWVLDLATGKLGRLGKRFEPSSLMFAKLSYDGRKAAYVVNHNIYAEDIATGRITPVTRDGSGTIINGTSDWVYEEEFGLRDGFRWSPDSRLIAFWQFDTSGVPDFHMIDNTGALYPRITTFKYPKAGERNSACRVGIVKASGGSPVWLKTSGDARNTYIPRMEWAGNAREVVLQHLNRLQNTLTVMVAEASTGAARAILTDRDDAWVEIMDDFIWLADGQSLLWLSERDGWRHAYRVPRAGGEPKLLTPGEYDVLSIEAVDEREGWLYVTASPEDATKRYLYRVRLDGSGNPERVTADPQAGVHGYQVSPTGKWAIHSYSSLDTPAVTDLVRLPGHEPVRTLAGNAELRAKVEALKRNRAEFFRIDIGGVSVDAWCIKPPDFDPAKKYPLFIHVYGEPAGQTVQDRWGGNSYLWHLMLAQQGYIIASFDSRGTPAPRGRAWRKAVYRQIGILASADQAAAVRAVLSLWHFVDPDRVGIWGWSGGGSMTLNAMFRYPELYKTGISVAAVPDQRLYDSIYQERYMGLPKDNAEGFKNGSPITFARQLRGHLLIAHGTGDDNVHYQGFEALVDELVAHGKRFTMLSYPNRSHAISEGQGTTLHLYTAMTDFLRANLPADSR